MNSESTSVVQDPDLANRLARREQNAVEEFGQKLPILLQRNHEQFRRAVPGCIRVAESLTPHVGYAAARGYLASAEDDRTSQPFVRYTEQLRVFDLYHASACLPWDHYPVPHPDRDLAAVNLLNDIVHKRVYPTLRKRYGSDHCVEEAACELVGHVLLPGQDGEPRLASYHGRSRLESWLTAICWNLVRSLFRAKQAVGEADSEAAQPAEPIDTRTPDDQKAMRFVRQFYRHIVELVDGVVDPARLDKIAEHFSWSEREKALYRAGLTDRQKIVFQMLYFKGMPPSEVASILNVSRSYISQCIKLYRERLQDVAFDVIEELADAANVSVEVIFSELEELLKFFQRREWEPEWEALAKDDDQFARFLNELRQQRKSN